MRLARASGIRQTRLSAFEQSELPGRTQRLELTIEEQRRIIQAFREESARLQAAMEQTITDYEAHVNALDEKASSLVAQ